MVMKCSFEFERAVYRQQNIEDSRDIGQHR